MAAPWDGNGYESTNEQCNYTDKNIDVSQVDRHARKVDEVSDKTPTDSFKGVGGAA